MSDSVMAAAKSHLAQGKFFGLRWKSFLWLSLLLLALSSVFYVLSYHELYRQFQAREQADIHFLRHHIQGLFTGSSDRLTRLGGALVTMSDIREALRSQSKKQIEKLMSGYYASLGYELDMRQIELYANDGSRVGHWASFGEKEIPEAFYRFAIASVQREEKPITLLHCHPHCLLYAFVPILASGENVGVIALGQSIADFIIDFNLITGANLALVIPDDNSGGTMLPPWRSRIPALTNTDKLQPLLQHLANRYSKPDALDRGLIIAWNRAYYDIYRIPLQEIIPGQAGFILLITDVSSNIQDIHSALRQELLTTLASLLLAEMILIYLIRAPLRRLSQLSLHLPLLAQGHHAQARRYFSSIRNNKRPRDEIDFLYESAEQLSHQLEENTLSLAAKNRELAEERDFVQNLLASAQVLVITQTKNGVIRICNAFMADLVGCAGPELYGRRFVDLIADGDFRQDIQSQLQALCESDLRRMEHEDDLICANGERRKVVWVHTPLRKAYIDGTAVLSVGMDITERVRAESKMRWLANNDPLTSLTNRHSFIEHLTRYYETAQHGTSIATLLLFDLDHFKEINDTSGHAAGDDLLRTIAQELKSHARKSDIVARLGGDEFAVLMPQTDPYGAEAFAKHLNERLSQMPFVYGEKRYRIGASIGIAFLPQHGANAQEAMANADLAMFEAKRSGRSRTHVYSEDLQQSQALTQNVYWKDVLTQAMETEQLIFYYQPVVDIQTGRTCYCEALLRLRMADGRIAAPGEFLPTAERSGLIYALDCYVVSILLKDLLKNPHKHLSINLSTAALNDFGWTTPLIDAVKQEKLDPKRVIFEITETAVIADVKKAKQIVQAIIDLGFEFSVDDFGAGFSSLYYLKQLPVHCVKIDQSLVKDIVTNQEDHDFVQALVTMIHVYGKKVVVEGVEDLETLNLLKDMHVDMVQGYYLGRPNPGYVL